MEKLTEKFRELLAKVVDQFESLNERDRTIVLGAAVVIATLSFVGLTYTTIKGIERASRQVTYKSEQLREIIGLRDVFKRAQEQNAAFRARLAGNDVRLTALVEEEAKKLSIEVGNLTPHSDDEIAAAAGVKTQVVEFRTQKLTYDRLMLFLQRLEEQQKPVRIIRLKLNNRFDEKDLIDAEITVATYKAT